MVYKNRYVYVDNSSVDETDRFTPATEFSRLFQFESSAENCGQKSEDCQSMLIFLKKLVVIQSNIYLVFVKNFDNDCNSVLT